MIKQLVKEHVAQYGSIGLSDIQLLKIIVGEKAAHKVDKLIHSYDLENDELNICPENIYRIASLPLEELMSRSGMTEQEAARIVSAVSLGTRIAMSKKKRELRRIYAPQDLADYLSPMLRHLEYEVFGCVLFNTKNEIIATKVISKGSINSAVVHPSMILLPAITYKATAVAVFHNHPSGHSEPSTEDQAITDMLKEACRVCNIAFLDHIIVSENSYYSFRENFAL